MLLRGSEIQRQKMPAGVSGMEITVTVVAANVLGMVKTEARVG